MYRCCVYILLSCLFTNAMGSICRAKSPCVGLRDCAPYMSLIDTMEKPLKASVVNFLRAQQCGFSDGYPKVCCSVLPKGLKIFESTNQVIPTSVKELSIDTTTEKGLKRGTPSFHIIVSTAPPRATAVPYISLETKKKRIEDLNRAFGDFMDFDLFRRRRSPTEPNVGLDIEIR